MKKNRVHKKPKFNKNSSANVAKNRLLSEKARLAEQQAAKAEPIDDVTEVEAVTDKVIQDNLIKDEVIDDTVIDNGVSDKDEIGGSIVKDESDNANDIVQNQIEQSLDDPKTDVVESAPIDIDMTDVQMPTQETSHAIDIDLVDDEPNEAQTNMSKSISGEYFKGQDIDLDESDEMTIGNYLPPDELVASTEEVTHSEKIPMSEHLQELEHKHSELMGDDDKTVDMPPISNDGPKVQEIDKIEDNQSKDELTALANITPVPYRKKKSNHGHVLWLILFGLLVGGGLGYFISQSKQPSPKLAKSINEPSQSQQTQKTTKDIDGDTSSGGAAVDLVESKAPVMAVEAVRPSNFVQTDSLIADGVIAGSKTAMVGAKASGLSVEEVFVDVGDTVKAGQTLAILDDKMAQQDVVAMTADKKQAEIVLQKATSDFERIQSLMDIDAISWQQYDTYKATKLQAEANLQAIEARLANTERQETNTKVVAPVSGVISERLAEVGMMTTGGALFGIVKTEKVEWQASIKATDRQKVSVGQQVRLKNGATGKVARISPTANSSRDLTVFVSLDNAKNTPVGSYHSGEFLLASQHVLTVPARVVASYDGGEYVWVIEPVQPEELEKHHSAGKKNIYVAKKQPLTQAKHLDDKVVVNLPKSTLIVKSGGNFLSEGDWVTLTAIDDNPTDERYTLGGPAKKIDESVGDFDKKDGE